MGNLTNNTGAATALQQLLNLARDREMANDMTAAARFLRLAARQAVDQGEHETALDLVDQAVAKIGDSRPADRFALLFQREQLNNLLGRREAQQQDLLSLEALAEQLDDDSRRAIVATRQAALRLATGDVGSALSLATLALRLSQLTGAHGAAATANLTLGKALITQSHFSRAEYHLQNALTMATSLGDNALKADALRRLGVLYVEQEKLDGALTAYTQAEALYAGSDNRRGRAQVLNNRAHVFALQGQLGRARADWQEAAAQFAALDDAAGIIRARINSGALDISLGRYEEATRQLETALSQSKSIRLAPGICFSGLNLGLAAQRQGKHRAALAWLTEARQEARRMGARHIEGNILVVMGRAYSGLGELAQAGDVYWEALGIWEELELPNLAAETRAGLAHIAHANSAPTLAMGFVEQILQQLARDSRLEGAEAPVDVLYTAYRVLRHAGDPRAATIRRQAQDLLDQRLSSITDPEARQGMAQNIPTHRELLALRDNQS